MSFYKQLQKGLFPSDNPHNLTQTKFAINKKTRLLMSEIGGWDTSKQKSLQTPPTQYHFI